MTFVTNKSLSRRTVLRGLGATVALPFMDAMVPAHGASRIPASAPALRMGFVYVPNGIMDLKGEWTPKGEGRDFEFSQITAGLEPLRELPRVGDVRVLGGVGVVELAPAPGDAGGYFAEIGPRVARAFLDRGLLIRPLGNVVYFMPPYAITDDEAAWALGEIAAVVGAIDEL